ncbi:Cache 3/Cache 2 fusion domain-containing protein [Aquincola sp. S2]|uniref:Cache 3/Cache 2 fusion domain-containing protein n=1 Tax=Pseudaquabacterium terrae TaxID=2732868 RepID=A0ABX2EFS4_9BURK|nr:methyl-accepting chemotaxis protein [Aquabacterium terrae]NRF67463.1 Cache 3/Cache 2 fusion domain-containing protein [Aquabacterium terrae]
MQTPSIDPPRASVARRITLIGGAFLLVVLAGICAVMTVMLSKRAQERTVSWVDAKVEAVAQAMDAYDQTAKLLVERFFKVFGDQFGKNFTLDEANGRLTQLGIALNEYHNPCDKFTEFTGGAAAVLMKKGAGFVAISTSLKNDKGERAIGMPVDAGHPAHAALLGGKHYVGRASLYGRSFITRLQPVRDLQGQVVGALFVAFDLSEFDRSLEQMVAGARFFDSGGVYVLDPRGGDAKQATLMLPPALRGRTLAEVSGAAPELLGALRAAKAGSELSDVRAVLRPGASDRFAVSRPSAGTGWLVVGEVSSREAMQQQWATLAPFLAMFAVAALALCAGQFLLIRRWVAKPLQSLTQSLQQVADGDLSRPVPTGRADEIGHMMSGVERLRQRFIEMLGAVRSSADAISLASAEIACGNQDLSRRTEETAARLQQTTSAMEQVHGNVRQTADATRSADALACSASAAAERGGAAMRDVVQKMAGICASSKRIAEITGAIDTIAFQTNILALNAAVEAARAGDSGRGFAVVAAEVRSLAQRSAAAAKEIKQLIGGSVEEVQGGSRLADAASERVQEILAGVRRVNTTLGEITASTREQSDGLGHINDSVATLDRMTQQNAALVEQSAAAAESMKAQAAALVASISQFRLETQADECVTSAETA